MTVVQPAGEPAKEPDHHPSWIHVELSLDIGGKVHEFTFEGRPTEDAVKFVTSPEYIDGPFQIMKSLGVAMEFRIDDPHIMTRNRDGDDDDLPEADDHGDVPPRLRPV